MDKIETLIDSWESLNQRLKIERAWVRLFGHEYKYTRLLAKAKNLAKTHEILQHKK